MTLESGGAMIQIANFTQYSMGGKFFEKCFALEARCTRVEWQIDTMHAALHSIDLVLFTL